MNKGLQQVSFNDELSADTLIIKIKESYNYLFSRRTLILIFTFIGGVSGFLYATLKKPTYVATATFVLEEGDKAGGLAQYAGLANIAGINIGGGSGLFQSENILELYKSRTMIKAALLEQVPVDNGTQQLVERYLEFKGLKKKWHDIPKLKNISFRNPRQFTVTHDSIFNHIISDINKNILVVGKSSKSPGIFQVEVKSEDQLFSKSFADEIVKTVNNFYIETKTKKTKENLANLQHQTDSVKAVMNNTIYSSAAIMDATPNLNPTRQRLRVPMESSRAGAEANKIILAELVKNLELMKMSSRREVPLIQIIDAPVYPLEKLALGKVKGLFLGALLSSFLICFALLTIKIFKTDKDN